MRRLKIILRSRYIIKICTIFVLILTIFYTKYYPFKSKYNGNETSFIGIVDSYKIEDNKIKIILKGKEKLLVIYKYENKKTNISFGDKILVKGNLSIPNHNKIFNNFDYNKYLYNKKIYYIVNALDIDKIKNNDNYIYTIKNIIYKRINKLKSADYIKAFLLGDSNLDSEVKNSYRINGISHLFSISGLHIGLITGIIYFYLNKVTYNKKIKYLIVDIILIIYLILCNTVSLYRCVIMNILLSLNNIFKLKIKKIDILLLTLIICIVINPFIIYDIGFIYSFVISFFLNIYGSKFKSNNKIKNIINITIISFIVALPINIYNNYEINFLSIIINIILVPVVSMLILPLCFITFIFPIFDNILYLTTDILENISLYISNINIFKIVLSKPDIFLIIIYYLIIIIILNNKKKFYLLIIILIIHKFSLYFNNNLKVVMFDVGQGDSIFIRIHSENIMIDTGNDEQISNIILYFKSIGINSLNYLIITHGDSDHMVNAISLVDNFKVENVIFNCGEYNDLEKELINVLNNKNIKYYSCIKELNIDNYKLYFLNTDIYDNENDNSSVIYFNFNNYKFLFMGDASTTREKDILKKYNINNIDFLKVGHHGSNTSSSKDFINSINPKYSLISVGKNNSYGHPKESVLDTLSSSKIYRTDIDGSIEIKIKSDGYTIETCEP